MVTSYGGDLFKAGDLSGDAIERSLALIEEKAEPPTDEVVYRMLVLLTRTTERVREGAAFRLVAAPVDFTELTSEYIGILYEGLLDYELHRAGNEPIVFLGLGDQPALPLDRLEAMPDKQLSALVEKAKVKKSDKAKADSDESDDEEADAEEEADVEDDAPEAEEVPVLDDIEPDDARSAALKRAMAWAERAAIAGKLVKAPKGKKGATDQAWKAELERTSRQLIAAVKLPGELYLVRWGGTRKGAGTFYTRPQLTLPTVRRTLEPLIFDEGGRTCPPEALLALKICDPAMGSGSFLVAALRVLTEAVVRSLHEHGRIVRGGDLIRIECDLLPDADRDQPEDRVESIVRRAVVEHCLYGVDLDPLAVELARVSLWVETLDRRLPFTFLDHKLRCGNALVGTWLDRFRDYPLLAWWRQSPDEKWKGVHHPADLWANALKEKRKVVVAEQVDLLTGQRNLLSAGVSDAELTAAIARVRELYRKLRRVPSTQPDKRAEIWRTKVAPDPAIARVREAFDTWCALWFWPPDKLDDAPTPMTLLAPSETSRAIVREVRMRQRFLHWELEFPDVFTGRGAGFHAIVGNPPWETRKPKSQEFYTNFDPLFRGYSKQDAVSRQRELFEEDTRIESSWLRYCGDFKDAGNFVRNAAEPYGDTKDDKGKCQVSLGQRDQVLTEQLHKRWATRRLKSVGCTDESHPFRHQGSADLNTYKLFAEMAYRLLVPRGTLGLIIPGAVLSDQGSRGLRELLIFESQVLLAYVFQDEKRIFRDIDHRSK